MAALLSTTNLQSQRHQAGSPGVRTLSHFASEFEKEAPVLRLELRGVIWGRNAGVGGTHPAHAVTSAAAVDSWGSVITTWADRQVKCRVWNDGFRKLVSGEVHPQESTEIALKHLAP